jgi:hypothetical protein
VRKRRANESDRWGHGSQKFIDQFADDFWAGQFAEDSMRETLDGLKALKDGEDEHPSLFERRFMYRQIHMSDAWFHPAGAPPIVLGHTGVLLSQVAARSVGGP